MGRTIEPRPGEASLVPLVGRRDELRALVAALIRRQSRLIVGPPGIGKTRLLSEALHVARQPAVCIDRHDVLHDLLVDSARRLGCRSNRHRDVRRATSISLKPMIIEALRRAPRCIVLDDLSNADPRMYRFLQELYYLPGNCLVVTARSHDCLGHVRKLLWDPREEIPLQPLSRDESRRLFDEAARALRLEDLNLEEFRSKALSAARGNPGQIIAMCRLAAQPEYQDGRHVKFLPLRIDVLCSFVV